MTADTDSTLLQASSSSNNHHHSNTTSIQVTPPPSSSSENKLKLFFLKLFHKSHDENNLKRSTSFFDRFKKNNKSNTTVSSSKSDLSKKSLHEQEPQDNNKNTHESSMSLFNDLCDVVVVEEKISHTNSETTTSSNTKNVIIETPPSTTPLLHEFLCLFNANSNTLVIYDENELKKMIPLLDQTNDIPSLQNQIRLHDHGDDISCVLSVQQKSRTCIFTGSHDNTILQYEYQKNSKDQPFKLIHTFQDEKNTVECLSHYKNHFLLSGSRDKIVRLRKIQHSSNSSDEELTCVLARLEGHTSWIQSVYGGGSEEETFVDSCIFSSQRSASVKESEIYMWNLEKQTIVQKLSGHEGTVYKMAHLKSTLLSASQDSTIKMWDVRTSGGDQVGELKGHTDWVKDVSTRGDNHVISCSLDGTLRLWDIRNVSTCVKVLFDFNSNERLKDQKYGFTSMSLSQDKLYLGSNHGKYVYTYDLKHSQMKCCEIDQDFAVDGICIATTF